MPTEKQALGDRGEREICRRVKCPRCSREKHLRPLPTGFQCADLICKFCGFLAQVKSVTLKDGEVDVRKVVLGAAWRPQQEQIISGIFHSLFVVGYAAAGKLVSIHYVPSHILQATPQVFEPRKPLRPGAKRYPYQGFNYRLDKLPPVGIQCLYPPPAG
jgi:transcription elongation factor Elf1